MSVLETTNYPEDDPPPQAPVEPDLRECCGSGCHPCILDYYNEELQEYRRKLAQWQQRQAEREARP